MNFQKYLRLAAVCSVLGAITTGLLIYLPNPAAEDFEAMVLLHQSNLHLAKLWILFLHPQFNSIAVLGITVLLLRRYPVYIIPGTLFILVWAFSEMAQQAYMIDAVNQLWRPGYLQAADEAAKQAFYSQLVGAEAIRDSLYFLVIYGFGLGTLLIGLALLQTDRLGSWIGAAFVLIGILSISSFARYYLGMGFLSGPVDWVYDWIYPVLQPAVRIALGLWLWRQLPSVTGT
jgi:hypothetical protein